MVKLLDILKELSVTGNVDEIGHIWGFASDAQISKGWEKSRLKTLFKGSLKNWEEHPTHPRKTIHHSHDINQTKNQFKAGQSSDKVHIPTNHTVHKNMYEPDEVDIYINDDERPDPLKKY